ncbi:MAG TPA: sulfite exporter TauE/SafE family protein [Polyangiales bacterium]|nr:sulfite exporter TauE/SafE family protein [Polyangiales bacterium]
MLIALLSLTSLLTAVLSAVFGMAGGMLLMGVYAALLPIPTAMVMHGATQLISNLARAYLLWRAVYWRGVGYYVIGSAAAFAALSCVHWVPDPWLVFLGLGLTPFIAAVLPARWFDFERPRAAAATGCAVAALQLTAGAAGPLLDIAFVDSKLGRHQVVATKAVTQCFSHSLKLAYFLPALARGSVDPGLVLGVFLATLSGTKLGTAILERMSDATFRRYSRTIVLCVGSVYLCKATWLLW